MILLCRLYPPLHPSTLTTLAADHLLATADGGAARYFWRLPLATAVLFSLFWVASVFGRRRRRRCRHRPHPPHLPRPLALGRDGRRSRQADP